LPSPRTISIVVVSITTVIATLILLLLSSSTTPLLSLLPIAAQAATESSGSSSGSNYNSGLMVTQELVLVNIKTSLLTITILSVMATIAMVLYNLLLAALVALHCTSINRT
jgi:hypothetical protein